VAVFWADCFSTRICAALRQSSQQLTVSFAGRTNLSSLRSFPIESPKPVSSSKLLGHSSQQAS
jgi:hypothetical protein